MTQYVEKTLRSAHTFLSRWNGASAEMWKLTSAHRALDIVIRRDYEGRNLVISCLDPITIKGPVRWQECRLRVSTTTLANTGETGFLVLDEKADGYMLLRLMRSSPCTRLSSRSSRPSGSALAAYETSEFQGRSLIRWAAGSSVLGRSATKVPRPTRE